MALTKAEMAEALFNQLGLNKREARELVDLFFEEVRAALSNGEQVKLSGFGNFDLRDKNQRPGRNPKTGEEIPISARRVVTFRPGQKLKARVEARQFHLLPVRERGADFFEEEIHELARFTLVEPQLVEKRFRHFRFSEGHAFILVFLRSSLRAAPRRRTRRHGRRLRQ